MSKSRKWYIGYIMWIPGDRMSRDEGNEFNLSSEEECRRVFAKLSINRRRGYVFQSATAHGPNGEEVDLLKRR